MTNTATMRAAVVVVYNTFTERYIDGIILNDDDHNHGSDVVVIATPAVAGHDAAPDVIIPRYLIRDLYVEPFEPLDWRWQGS